MGHSMRGFLSRRSTQELDEMLQYYLTGDRWKDNEHTVLKILEILARREKDMPPDITPRVQKAWEEYLQNIKSCKE